MLPNLLSDQNTFIEITNLEHGGDGWGLGVCMWSPTEDRAGHATWSLMNEINKGDAIIHLVKIDDSYHWYAISLAYSDLITTTANPTIPGKWAGFDAYQRVNLSNFYPLLTPYPVEDLFSNYDLVLREILESSTLGQFYVEYGKKRDLRMAQRYIAKCPNELYALFSGLSDRIGFNPIFQLDEYMPTNHEPQNPDFAPPARVNSVVSRIVRDTALSREMKAEFTWRCYICGHAILLPNNLRYAEGHHLQPLGGEYRGPDVRENIIIVCPNHHAEFDYGTIAVNPDTGYIEHIDDGNPFHTQPPAYYRGDIGARFLRFHYTHRFRQ